MIAKWELEYQVISITKCEFSKLERAKKETTVYTYLYIYTACDNMCATSYSSQCNPLPFTVSVMASKASISAEKSNQWCGVCEDKDKPQWKKRGQNMSNVWERYLVTL